MIDRWLNSNQIMGLLSTTIRWVRQRAKTENWSYRSRSVRGGKERLYRVSDLPEDVQIAYASSVSLTFEGLQNELKPALTPHKKVVIDGYDGRGAKVPEVVHYDKLKEKWKEVAEYRRQVLAAYSESGRNAAEFIADYRDGKIVPELREKLGPHGDIRGKTSLYRWLERYERHGLAGLAPQYEEKGLGHSLPQEAKDRLEWLYLDSSRPSVKAVWRLLGQYGINVTETTARRYVNTIPGFVQSIWRDGKDKTKAKYHVYIERDYTKLRPMELICGDYMTQDFVVRKGDRVIRARLCAFLDMRSRTIVGWNLQETANSVGVVRSLRMAFFEYGLPESLYVDNGKEFKNKQIGKGKEEEAFDPEHLNMSIGILAECGVDVTFAKPYNGQAKPIERFWRTLHDNFDRFQLSYTGSNTSDRPDETKAFRRNVEKMKKEDLDLIPGFEDTEKRIGNFMAWYNEQWSHSGQGMDGRTPLEVFREYAGPKREIPDHLKKYLFTVRCIKKVQRNGVRIEGEWFQHKDFVSHNGQDVEVRQSIDDAGIVHVFSLPDRVYLFDAEYLPNSGILRENIERKKKLQRDMNETAKKYNRMQEEFNRGPFSTPAETYAAEAAAELKVVNGEPLAAGPGPALTLVRAEPKKKKRLTILDVD